MNLYYGDSVVLKAAACAWYHSVLRWVHGKLVSGLSCTQMPARDTSLQGHKKLHRHLALQKITLAAK